MERSLVVPIGKLAAAARTALSLRQQALAFEDEQTFLRAHDVTVQRPQLTVRLRLVKPAKPPKPLPIHQVDQLVYLPPKGSIARSLLCNIFPSVGPIVR